MYSSLTGRKRSWVQILLMDTIQSTAHTRNLLKLTPPTFLQDSDWSKFIYEFNKTRRAKQSWKRTGSNDSYVSISKLTTKSLVIKIVCYQLKYVDIDQYIELRIQNELLHLWSVYFWQGCQNNATRERIVFSTNGWDNWISTCKRMVIESLPCTIYRDQRPNC